MRCSGITKNFKRCKNPTRFIFCHSHKLQWWGIVVIIATIGGLYQDVLKPSFLTMLGWIDSSKSHEIPNSETIPIFSQNDSISFNVLILNFEDYIKKERTDCIARAVQENLNDLSANDSLPLILTTKYIDSVETPRSRGEAQLVQNRHNADLVIYGLARNVMKDCAGAELCFRYIISEPVVAKATPAIKVKSFAHGSSYDFANTIDIEQDSLKVNSLSLKKWTRALINLKADRRNDAFLELDEILKDARDMVKLGTKMINGEKHITFTEILKRKNRYSSIGKTYFDLKLYEKSLMVFDTAISLYPEDGVLYQNRGAIYGILKQYNKSLNNLDSAILLNPMDAVAYVNRGGVYDLLSESQKAMADFNNAISKDSSLSNAYFGKGNLYLRSEQYEKAIKEYSTVIDLNPEDLDAYSNRGAAYLYLKQYTNGIQDLKKVMKAEPENVSALNNLSAAYSYLELYSEAVETIMKSISIDPKNPLSHQNMGIILSQMNKYEKSIKSFSIAIELDSLDAFAYNNRAYSLLKLNKINEAFNDLQKSKSLDDKNSWLYRNFACYYILKSNNLYANKNLEKAIFLGYNDISWFETEEILDPIRENTQFKKMLRKISIRTKPMYK